VIEPETGPGISIEIFSAWGVGPDVGINIKRTEEQAKQWTDPHLNCYLDFTVAEARALAAEIIAAADLAEAHDRAYNDYETKNKEK